MSRALDRLRHLLGARFEELSGTYVAGQLPFTDAVVNRAIAEQLRSSARVAAAHVHARDGDALDVHLTLRGVPLISSVPLGLRIRQQPVLPDSPVLGIEWSLAGLGALARMAGPFITRLASLPPGVRMDENRITLDLREALRTQGLEDLLRLARRLEVHTQEGRIVLHFEVSS